MKKIQPLEFLKETKKQIDAHIFDFLPSEHDHPEVHQFYQMMLDYPLRAGKGLRPAICLLICAAFGGDPRKAINTAAALELLQNWALIHDDIEDGSDLRRGEPCLHQKHGIPIAINVGDGLHCKMWEMLNRNADLLGYELAFEIVSEFAQLSNSIVEGQHIELSWVENNRWDLAESDYWTMCVRKTASYTCITPCRVGALIAGASKNELDLFVEMGKNLGVAFQIQDDVLNLIGEERLYGKEIGGDISEGKRTLILIHLLNTCSQTETNRITEIMGQRREDKHQDEIQEVLALMERYKSIQYAQQRAKTLAQKAYTQFNQTFSYLPETEAKHTFLQLVHFLIEREY